MGIIARSICWALALLMIAVGARFGLLAAEAARTMFCILPALAVLSITGRGRCCARVTA